MHFRSPDALAFMLALTLVATSFSIAYLPFSHASVSTTPSGYYLSNVLNFNTFGQFSVNETLHETTNSTAGLSSVVLGFPAAYEGHIVAISLHGKSGSSPIQVTSSTTVSNNTVSIALSMQPALSAGANSTVSLGFYVVNTFKPVSDGNFSVPMLFSPAVNIQLDKIVTGIVFPYSITNVADPTPLQKAGFSQTTNATIETWNYTGTNVSNTVRSGNVTVFSTPSSSGALDFTSITRQLSIDSSGQVIVQDTLDIRNLGENTISSLAYSPLTNATTLNAVPASEPPLSNLASISIVSGSLNLTTTEQSIQPTSSVSLVYEYPLGQQYWHYSNGEYVVSIPTTVPVSAIVDKYSIASSSVSGIVLTGSQLSLTAYNTTQIGSGNTSLTYRIGIASAFGSALPIAGILFIVVFVGALVFRPRQEEKEDVTSTFDTLQKAIEDKVSSTNEILSELKAKGQSATRNDLVVARSRIDDFRMRTNSKIGAMRSQLSASTTSVQAGLNELTSNDRDFDRVVRDMLNNYDQYITRKMKEETFRRLQQTNERRLQTVTNALLDCIHDLEEEYESEE